MLERKIALFVDLENVDISYQNFTEILEQLHATGSIVYCKVYGFNPKHHADIGEIISKYGFITEAIIKESKKRKFDVRIAIDALKISYTNDFIDSYCFVANYNGLAYLSNAIRETGREVIEVYGDRMLNEMADLHIRLVSYFVQDYDGAQTTQKLFMINKMSKFAQEITSLAKSNNKEERASLLEEIEAFLDKNSNTVEILETAEELELYRRIEDSLDLLRD
ncbi:MAG: NYN domain-containing protein [Clostridia bacterium]|jgi:hypothetical protein|nr:NYN domain-containing protein [Clostridia bacterium]MDD4275730.1 NYN domain-containing protein [Clostridia bacterium]